jgi:diacylglycerol kinase (ATP)
MSYLPLVIVNPASASGGTGSAWVGLASDLRNHFGAFNCAFTKGTGDGRLLALAAAQEGRRLIIACGGDGTISEVANGILESGTDAELGVLPSGTGGDFRRTLGIPAGGASAACALRTGTTRRVDVGRVSYFSHKGERETKYFVGVASFGMSGQIIARVKENGSRWLSATGYRWLGGKISFASATLQTTLSSRNTPLLIKLDKKPERRLTVANLCVANARYFGGGMKIAPEANMKDGMLDVVAIGDLGPLEILANAHQLYLGTHLGMTKVHHAHARRVTARPAEKDAMVAIEVDGELPGFLPATLEIVPDALNVRWPKKAN